LQPPPTFADAAPLAAVIEQIETLQRAADQGARRVEALNSLHCPPELEPIQPLVELLESLSSAASRCSRAQHTARALQQLPGPLETAAEQPLAQLIAALTDAHLRERQLSRSQATLQALCLPPTAQETGRLEELVRQMDAHLERATTCARELQSVDGEIDLVRGELQACAADQQCNVCGAPLDFDRLVAQAISRGDCAHA
jgi:hypothetical protein